MNADLKKIMHKLTCSIQMLIIPDNGVITIEQVVSILPLGRTKWREGINAGKFPKPINVNGHSCWKKKDVLKVSEQLSKA